MRGKRQARCHIGLTPATSVIVYGLSCYPEGCRFESTLTLVCAPLTSMLRLLLAYIGSMVQHRLSTTHAQTHDARPRVHERPTASAAISDSRQNAASASQAQSVAHRKLHRRSRGCRRRADASVLPRRRALEAVSEYAVERRGYERQAGLKTRLYAAASTKPRLWPREGTVAPVRGPDDQDGNQQHRELRQSDRREHGPLTRRLGRPAEAGLYANQKAG